MIYEFEKMGRIPDNEFAEICTGDMITMDTAWHYWQQDKYKEQREDLEKKHRESTFIKEK